MAILALATVIAVRNTGHGNRPENLAVVNPQQLLIALGQRLADLEPRDPEAVRLSRTIATIRRKMHQTEPKAQDPGAFLEGLIQVKTGVDGRTYSPGYRTRERELALQRTAGVLRKSQAPNWVERGPGNVSGRARAIVVDPSDPAGNTWFVATVGGGVWLTNDAGASWTPITPQLTTLSTTSIAISQSNPDVIYVGTGMGYGRVIDLAGSGVWKSVDHGLSWSQLPNTANGELLGAINRIVVDPQNEDLLLVASNNSYSYLSPNGGNRTSGIYRSADGGATWTRVFDPDAVFGSLTDNRVQQILANPQNFNTLYATVNEVGIIKSVDGGLTWSVSVDNLAPYLGGIQEGSYQGISTRIEIAIAPTDTSRLYAAVERWKGIADLYASFDAGGTWHLISDTGSDPNWFNSFGLSGALGYSAGWFDNTIIVHPSDPNVVFVGGVNTYRIDVTPENFSRHAYPIAWTWPNSQGLSRTHPDHHWLATIPANDGTGNFRILDANDGGIAVSPDGGDTWQELTGMISTQFYGVDKKPGENVFIGGMQDNGTWRSPADPTLASLWSFDWGGDGVEVVWNYANPDLILAGSQYGNLSRSEDGGASWAALAGGPQGTGPFISKIAGSKIDADLVFSVGTAGVHRSDDFGASWTLTPMATNWIGNRAFDNVEISVADPQVVWATSKRSFDVPRGRQGGVHVSADGGLSFSDVSANLPATVNESSGIASHPTDDSTAYLLFSAPDNPKILKTTDLGQTWQDISGFTPAAQTGSRGLPNVAVFSLLVMPFDENEIWAGTEIGLFISLDAGLTWAYADNGLPHVSIFQMSIVDDTVLLATYGRGLWTAALPELAGYTPPLAVLSPRLVSPAQAPTGRVALQVDLRSAYDSSKVFIAGQPAYNLGANSMPYDTLLYYAPATTGQVSIQVRSYRGGRVYASPAYSVTISPISILSKYSTSFNAGDEGHFWGNGFSITSASGFSSPAAHTLHPYPEQLHLRFQLKPSIAVAPAGQALMTFDEVVLVEEGVVDDYLNAHFYDYVIVEGSIDGATWLPLLDGYDSRARGAWSIAYNSNLSGLNSTTQGSESLFFKRVIDLGDTFNPQDTIAIRFRVFSDALAVGWGWAIDNLQIQSDSPDLGDFGGQVPNIFTLHQNFPNPFNLETTIRFGLPEAEKAKLVIYDMRGRLVRTLQDGLLDEGFHAVRWQGLDQSGRRVPSGVYIIRLTSPLGTRTIKSILLK